MSKKSTFLIDHCHKLIQNASTNDLCEVERDTCHKE